MSEERTHFEADQKAKRGSVSRRKGGNAAKAGSRVGNGSVLLPDVDGRTSEARRYRDILNQLVADLGGDPSEAKTIIARRAATLAVWCESCEAEMARGGDLDIGAFTTATNALRRLLTDLGLERRAKDITPTIADYMRGHHSTAEAA